MRFENFSISFGFYTRKKHLFPCQVYKKCPVILVKNANHSKPNLAILLFMGFGLRSELKKSAILGNFSMRSINAMRFGNFSTSSEANCLWEYSISYMWKSGYVIYNEFITCFHESWNYEKLFLLKGVFFKISGKRIVTPNDCLLS